MFEHCFYTRQGDESRTVLRLPPVAAPFKASVFPLLQREDMNAAAQKLSSQLSRNGVFNVIDTTGALIRQGIIVLNSNLTTGLRRQRACTVKGGFNMAPAKKISACMVGLVGKKSGNGSLTAASHLEICGFPHLVTLSPARAVQCK